MALKVLALSKTIRLGVPLLAHICFKQLTKVVARRFWTSTRCTARVIQHVNSVLYHFVISPTDPFTYSGPVKSTPTLLKGGDSFTLNSGSVAEGGE